MKKMIKLLIILSLPLFLILSCGSGSKTAVDDDSAAVVPDSDEENNEDAEETDEKPDEKPSGNDEDGNTGTKPKPDPCKNKPCYKHGGYTGACIPDEDGKGYSCKCLEDYEWDGRYCTPKTRNEECSGLPEHAHWNMVSSITQKQQEGEWIPSATGEYDQESSESLCRFICDENYFWNGSDCVNLCDAEPCKNLPHSDGVCSSVGAALYTCGCEESYYWWGEKLGCIAEKPAFGNICTGQNECYDDLNEIECPMEPGSGFFGQDAQYAKLGTCSPMDITPDSSNPEEPVLLSRNTGLMWQRKITMEGYTLENALRHCEKLTYAGYDDWRLPSAQELATIIVSSKYMVEYNLTFFNFFPAFIQESDHIMFWTSASDLDSPDNGQLMNFYDNRIGFNSKTEIGTAVCVRGEKLPGSLFETSEINGDEVVTDQATGLMWQKDPGTESSWKQALNYCENLVYAGFSDWRLPNRNELLSLVDYNKSLPLSDFPGISETSSPALSSTSRFHGTSSSGIIESSDSSNTVSLYDGRMQPEAKSDKSVYTGRDVFCVRSQICPEGKVLHGSECLDDPCAAASCEVENSTGVCIPETESAYECQCLEGAFWNGSKCVNPCKTDPCSKIANSDGVCTPVNPSLYYCGCTEGYTWANGKCGTFATEVKTLGSICTGQDTCYDNEKELQCTGVVTMPFPGQDAFNARIHKCAKRSFSTKTAAGQTIVTDNNTKLEWQQGYPQKAVTWNEAYAYCDSLEYGEKNDWRLPAPQEIMTIVNYDKSHPAINTSYFTEIPDSPSDSRNFWTDKVLVLDSDKGHTFSYASKDDIYFVMCVRGETLPTAKLKVSTVEDEKIAVDQTTGLMWTLGNILTDKWMEALSYCMKLTYAGYSNWRVPNKNELASLLGSDNTLPQEFSDIGSVFWSSTTYPYQVSDAVTLNLNGEFGHTDKINNFYPVICVGNVD